MKTRIKNRRSQNTAFSLFVVSVLALTAAAQGAAETNRTIFADAAPSTAANYAFTTTTSGTFTDMSSGTTQLVNACQADAASAVTNMPFDFYMLGTRYTQFSANSNGYIRLGGVHVSGMQLILGSPNIPLITALGSHLIDGITARIHYKVTGASPNRVLTVEFLNMTIIWDGGCSAADGTYQMRLYETTGVIQFVYGPMNRNTSTGPAQYVGFSINNTANNFATIDTAHMLNTTGIPAANQFPLGAPMASLNSPVEGSRRTYEFHAANSDGAYQPDVHKRSVTGHDTELDGLAR
jgi:hypothetical protein